MLVLLAGLLPDPQHNISMMGITINIHALCFLLAQGIGDATCTRVAQYLGAGRPRRAFLTVKVRLTVSLGHDMLHHAFTYLTATETAINLMS